jgi:hypothetical protein
MRGHVAATALCGFAAVLAAFAGIEACSSFTGDDPSGTNADADATRDGDDVPEGSSEAGTTDSGDGASSTFSVACGASTCAGPASYCCYPPGGAVDASTTCLPTIGSCAGDNTAVFCDEPSDCPPSYACCATVQPDNYRVGPVTCRTSCGGADASTNDLRLCNPSKQECPRGDCVGIGEANMRITGGAGLIIGGTGLYACNAK